MKKDNIPMKTNTFANSIAPYLFAFISFMAFAYLGARTALVNTEEGDMLINWIGFGLCMLNLAVAMFIQTILHEGGHLIAGLVTGYKSARNRWSMFNVPTINRSRKMSI